MFDIDRNELSDSNTEMSQQVEDLTEILKETKKEVSMAQDALT